MPPEKTMISAVYTGVADRGAPETVLARAADFRYCFSAGGETYSFPLAADPADPFRLPNLLKHGRSYRLEIRDGRIVSLSREGEDPPLPAFRNPFRGVPGERTLRNFLRTALMPVGSALYVFGGGWNFQDDGPSLSARSIGPSPDWRRFFLEQTADYTYRDPFGDEKKADPATSFYPYGGFNEYGFAGLDCSGYVSWTVYNTLETESGGPGYPGPSTLFAGRMAARGMGSLSRPALPEARPLPGDIVSISGHIWLSLGTCGDGSVLMLHSTPSPSRSGQPGGGVQMGAVGPDCSCEAYRLARAWMERYCPEWFARYDAALKDPETYFSFKKEETGIFSWALSGENGGLRDPEGLRALSPERLLAALEA